MTARVKYDEWLKEQDAFYQDPKNQELEPEEFERLQLELEAKRDRFVRVDSTGFVWLLRQK